MVTRNGEDRWLVVGVDRHGSDAVVTVIPLFDRNKGGHYRFPASELKLVERPKPLPYWERVLVFILLPQWGILCLVYALIKSDWRLMLLSWLWMMAAPLYAVLVKGWRSRIG